MPTINSSIEGYVVSNKPFVAFSKLLHYLVTSGFTKAELRDALVKHCETTDLIVLIDVFDDLLAKSKTEDK